MQKIRECPQSGQSMDRVKWAKFIRSLHRRALSVHSVGGWLREWHRMNIAHFTLSIDCSLCGHSRIFCIVIPFHGNHHQIAYTLNTLQLTSPPQPTTRPNPDIFEFDMLFSITNYWENVRFPFKTLRIISVIYNISHPDTRKQHWFN